MALSPWHQNGCLKHGSFTQEISFLGLASVTHLLSFSELIRDMTYVSMSLYRLNYLWLQDLFDFSFRISH